MVHGVFAAVEHNPVLIGRFLTLVDIGANRGQFSLAFRALNPKAKIYAFEESARRILLTALFT